MAHDGRPNDLVRFITQFGTAELWLLAYLLVYRQLIKILKRTVIIYRSSCRIFVKGKLFLFLFFFNIRC